MLMELMAAMSFVVAAMYALIAFQVVPRLAAAAQGGHPVLLAARWGATAFFAGCAVTHLAIGASSAWTAFGPDGPGMDGAAMTGHSMSGESPWWQVLFGILPHVAQLIGGFLFIGIAARRLEWTVMSKDVAQGFRTREMQFRSAFDRAPVGVALVSLDSTSLGQVLQINPFMRALTGADHSTSSHRDGGLTVTSLGVLPPAGSGDAVLGMLRRGQEIESHEQQLLHPDGDAIWISVEASVVEDEQGSPAFAVLQARDITEQRRRNILRVTQHAVAEVVMSEVDLERGISAAIRELCEGLGWAGGEYWQATAAQESITRVTSWWAPAFHHQFTITSPEEESHAKGEGLAGTVWESGERLWVPDLATAPAPVTGVQAVRAVRTGRAGPVTSVVGLPINVRDRATVLLLFAPGMDEPDGEMVTALEAIAAHIGRFTERRRAEDFRQLAESAPDAVVICDPEGMIVLVNAQTELLFGYHREDLLGQSIDVLVPPGGDLDPYGLRRDGTTFPAEISVTPLQRDGEQLTSRSIRNLTARRQADELRFQLAAIVDSSHDAIIGSTLDGRISSWNRAAQEIFGPAEAEALGAPVSMLLPHGHEDHEQSLLAKLRAGERIHDHDAVWKGSDGREVEVSISMSPIRDPQGQLIGSSRVIRDITERKRAEAELVAAKDAAEAANQALQSFSYSVAHDLKAPLRSINGFSQLIAKRLAGSLDVTGLDYLQRVSASAQHMGSLIDGLLQLSRVTYRDVRLVTVDLSEIAKTVTERLQQEAPDRTVRVSIQPDLTTFGDPVLLTNVMQNLLGNAWKFTRDQPDPRIEVGQQDGDFFIRDNGAGFDMAYASRLFGVFQRLHTDSEFEGTGIGLATVQRIIERHGGRIWASSAPGQGATFTFTLAGSGDGHDQVLRDADVDAVAASQNPGVRA